jgi:hypothetical protein
MCLFVLWDAISVSLPSIETSGLAAESQGFTQVAFQMKADLLLMLLFWYCNVTYALQTHLYGLNLLAPEFYI